MCGVENKGRVFYTTTRDKTRCGIPKHEADVVSSEVVDCGGREEREDEWRRLYERRVDARSRAMGEFDVEAFEDG